MVLVCTRCKSEKRIPISDLIQHLEDWIAELRAMQENVAVPEPYFDKEEVAESAAHSSDVRPRVFAASRREDN